MESLVTTCRIVARPNPLTHDVVECEVPAGFALSEILSKGGVYAVAVDGEHIDNPIDFVVPNGAKLITIVGRPGGEAAAAWVVSTFALVGTTAAIVSWAIILLPYVATAVALVMVATMDMPKADSSGPPRKLNSLTGSKNQFNPYGPLPVLYGKRTFFPVVCAAPYTELVGQDQYLNMLFFVTTGQCTIEDVKIGETGLQDFEGVTYSEHYPNPPSWADIQEDVVGIELEDIVAGIETTPNPSHTATSEAEATHLSIDLVFPQGFSWTNSRGDRKPLYVNFRVEYQLASLNPSTDPWTNVRDTPWDTTTDGGATNVNGVPTLDADTGNLFASNHFNAAYAGGPVTLNAPAASPVSGYTRLTIPAGVRINSDIFKYGLSMTAGTPYMVGGLIPITTTNGVCYDFDILTANWNPPVPSYPRQVSICVNDRDTSFLVTEHTKNPFRVGLKWPTAAPGQYRVKVTRSSFGEAGHPWTLGHSLASTLEQRPYFHEYSQAITFNTLRTYTASQAVAMSATNGGAATYIALRIKASDQLNGTLDNLQITATRHLQAWDAGTNAPTGSLVATRSPAWAMLDMLTNPAVNHRAIYHTDSPTRLQMYADQIDVDSFVNFHNGVITSEDFCYDEMVDYTASVFDCLKRAAGTAWGGITVSDGKFSVVVEQSGTLKQMFTQKNYWDFKAQKTFIDMPHAIRVEFDSEEKENEQDQVIAYDDGYTATGSAPTAAGRTLSTSYGATTTALVLTGGSGSFVQNGLITIGSDPTKYIVASVISPTEITIVTPGLVTAASSGAAVVAEPVKAASRFETIRLPGVTVADNAWKHGRRLLATTRLRPETYSFKVGVEHLLVQRGDSVTMQADAGLIGIIAGRITAKVSNGFGGNVITLDEPVLTEVGQSYRIRVRRSDAAALSIGVAVPPAYGEYTTTWTVPDVSSATWQVGDLAAVGLTGIVTRNLKIIGITPEDMLTATITAVDDNPAVYTAHKQEIPPYDPGITKPANPNMRTPATPVISSVDANPNMADILSGGTRQYYVGIHYNRGSTYDAFTQMSALLRYRDHTVAGTPGSWQQLRSENATGSFSLAVTAGLTYEFQVRLVPKNMAPMSAWSNIVSYTAVTGAIPLTSVDDIIVTGVPGGFDIVLDVTSIDTVNLSTFEFRYGVQATHAHAANRTFFVAPTTDLGGITTIRTNLPTTSSETLHYFWVRWKDTAGNVSPWYPDVSVSTVSATDLPEGGATGPPGYNNATVILYKRTGSSTPPAGPTTSLTYTFATAALSGAGLNGWTQYMPDTGGGFRWQISEVVSSQSASVNIATGDWSAAALLAEDGTAGTGMNTATAYLYQRAATAPAAIDTTVGPDIEYTFADGSMANVPAPWLEEIPAAGHANLWVTHAVAISNATTDTIPDNQWSAPALLGTAGGTGATGATGYNSALIYLYQRSASGVTAPALPTGTFTYTYSSRGLTGGTLNGWSQSIPASGAAYLWVTVANAYSNIPTDTIAANEWTAATVMSVDGVDGAQGPPGAAGGLLATVIRGVLNVGSSRVGSLYVCGFSGGVAGAYPWSVNFNGTTIASAPGTLHGYSEQLKGGYIIADLSGVGSPFSANGSGTYGGTANYRIALARRKRSFSEVWEYDTASGWTSFTLTSSMAIIGEYAYSKTSSPVDTIISATSLGGSVMSPLIANYSDIGLIRPGDMALAVSSGRAVNSDPTFTIPTIGLAGDLSNAWTYISAHYNAAIVQDTGSPSGSNVLNISAATNDTAEVFTSALFPVDITKSYKLSCNIKIGSTGGNGQHYLTVIFYNAAGNEIFAYTPDPPPPGGWAGGQGTYHYLQAGRPTDTNWTQWSGTFGPKGAGKYPTLQTPKYMRIGVLLNNAVTIASDVRVSDLRLEELVTGVLIEDGAVTALKVAANAISADSIQANAITADKILAGSITAEKMQVGGSNLVQDPSFEFSAAPWVSSWTATVSSGAYPTITTGSYYGDKCVQILGKGAGQYTSVESARFPVRQGGSLLASLRLTRENASISAFQIDAWVSFYRLTGASVVPVGSVDMASLTAINYLAWEQKSFSGLVPSDASHATVNFAVTGGSGGVFYFDDFRVVDMTDSALIVNGAVTADKLEATLILASTITTKADTSSRVIIDNSTVPIWAGSGAKNAANAQLQYDQANNLLTMRGVLNVTALEPDSTNVMGVLASGLVTDGTAKYAPVWGVSAKCLPNSQSEYNLIANTDYAFGGTGQFASLLHPTYGSVGIDGARLQHEEQPFFVEMQMHIHNSAGSNAVVQMFLDYSFGSNSWEQVDGVSDDQPVRSVTVGPGRGVNIAYMAWMKCIPNWHSWAPSGSAKVSFRCRVQSQITNVYVSGFNGRVILPNLGAISEDAVFQTIGTRWYNTFFP